MSMLRILSFCLFVFPSFFASTMAADKPKSQQLGDIVCPGDEVLKHDGTQWVCAPDNDSPTTTLDWSAITGRPDGLDDGDNDTLGDVDCADGEVVKSDGGGGWECSPDDTGVPSSDTLAELDCLPGDVARFNGTEWECSDAVSRLELFQFGKRVFLSSLTFDGDFGGLTGADAACQVLAGSAGLPGMYHAWLSDGSGGPATRFTQSAAPYFLVDGTVIANDWADLVDGELNVPINIFENGVALTPSPSLLDQVWSNTDEAGTVNLASFSCGNWTSNSAVELGLTGSPNSAETPSESTEIPTVSGLVRLGWTRSQAETFPGSGEFGEAYRNCEAELRIYCVQQ